MKLFKHTAAVVAAGAVITPTAEGHGKGCNTLACDVRVAHKMGLRHKLKVIAPYKGWLAKIRACESGSRWQIATGNGFYGAYQFTQKSWQAVGGRGMPQNASRVEQSYRAVLLLKAQGPTAWPVCSR